MGIAVPQGLPASGLSQTAQEERVAPEHLDVARLEAEVLRNPESAETHHQLGLALYHSGQLRRAIEEQRQAILLSPAEVDYYLALADVFREANLTEEALTLLSRTAEAFPESIEVEIELGDNLFEAGRAEDALVEFRRASELAGAPGSTSVEDPATRAYLQRRIGEMHVHLLQFDDAISAFQAGLALLPDDVELNSALGRLYLRRNRLEEAISAYRRALAVDPRNSSAHSGVAEAHLRMGRFDEAIAAAGAAIESAPDDPRPYYLRAAALIRSGRTSEGTTAMEAYRRLESDARAAEHRDREIGSIYKAAIAQALDGNGAEAVRLLREGIDAYPDAGELYLNLGLTLNSLGRYEEAIDVFETMIDLGFGANPLVRSSLADTQASLNETGR